ncbi:hypothetical protein CDL15_Pgr021017 [Punica granatum]|uniref:Uncharacterized protein n=1 Tax=Punica granatum TaxID=22663 RepID=A0A218Y2D9_PUNGR|nr:hypothetical protein CDL15_Pgr021017 [Punica granatum]PKI46829.1 hypothetical protein CRG98_032767 [Punica granatum]
MEREAAGEDLVGNPPRASDLIIGRTRIDDKADYSELSCLIERLVALRAHLRNRLSRYDVSAITGKGKGLDMTAGTTAHEQPTVCCVRGSSSKRSHEYAPLSEDCPIHAKRLRVGNCLN